MKKLGIIFMIITMIFIGVGIGTADTQTQDDQIPNLTQTTHQDSTLMPQDTTDANGRAAKLDTEKESDQLNPVERAIIKRDAIRSNQLNPNK